MPDRSQNVFDEPMFGATPERTDGSEHEVWEEPALLPGARPDDPDATYAAKLREKWRRTCPAHAWALTLALAALAGPLAVLGAFLKSGTLGTFSAVVIMAPLVEELGKALAPLMLLERQPYRFTSGVQPLLICILSGFVFATIENLLYLHVYIADPSPSLMTWRRTVCVAVHVGCSTISGLGLRRVWLAARATQGRADLAPAAPCLIAAMVIHGAYNALAVVLLGSGIMAFDD